jgi:hypothetical protein
VVGPSASKAQAWRPGQDLDERSVVDLVATVRVIPVQPRLDSNRDSSANLQTPHYSTGAGGVIAKANWSCTYVPTTVFLNTATTGYWLWVCPSQGQDSESWIESNCTFKGGNHENIDATVSGQQYTRYVPPAGQPGAHGTGYWISCSIWYSSGPKGTDSDRTQFSAWWYGSG